MEKSLSLNEIRTRAASFVIAWRDAKGDEKQEDQSFIRELLDVFGVSQTRAALYQKRAQRSSTGNQGYIDALVPGLVLIEMKSKGKNLGLAEIQALDYIQYLEEAEVPRYILTSDFKRFRLLDLHGHKGKDTAEFLLEELPKNIETLGFLAGYETRSFGNREQEEASIKAAKIMGDLYENLEGSGYGDHEASIFLVRTLFALYADDAGVWQKDLFTEFLKSRTATDGTDLGPQLTMLFQTLNQPLEKRLKNLDEILLRFPYVNGGIFAEPLPIPAFDYKMRNQLLKACDFNWSAISPAVFGSLFQAVKSQEARRELGEHYTTERNILKTIEPLFLDDLRSTYAKAINDAQKLRQLRERLSHIRILDPACGCGNFLVVSYREMRRIELLVLSRLQELGDKTAIPTLFFERKDLAVKLENIKGIEIEEWPARIAQTALLLAEHQANIELEMALGRSPTVLPLETVTGIQIGNALTTDWRTVLEPSGQVIVLGNPPFLGHISRSHEQTEDLKRVWGRSDIGRLDFVSGWYKKAIDYFGEKNSGRFAFVSTNSISQGEPVPTLFRPIFEAGWRIRFAHQTFAWTSEAPGAAAVHCVIVGFDRESGVAELFTYANLKADPVASLVPNINAYLVAAPHILVEQRRTVLSPELLPVSMGSMPRDGGHLIINSREELDEVEKDPTAAKYIRRFIMGNEVINNIQRWCLWMVDLDPVDISRSEILKKRFSAVAESRLASSAESTRKMAQTPHLFGQRAQPTSAYVGIPKVFSENRKFATCDRFLPDVIAGDKVYTALDPDGFVFGVISSSMFITWQKLVGGRLESRPSFSNTIVWNNFPLPSTPPTLREAIVAAGENVQQVRAKFPTSSLADLYNPLAMDPSLLKAHAELDAVVDKAFGAQKRLHSSEEREQLLFEAFLRLSESEEEEGATRP